MLLNIILSIPAFAIAFYLAFINPHLLPLKTDEIVPVCLQAVLLGFLAATMFAIIEKKFTMIGMLTSLALLIGGFLGNPEINIPFNLAINLTVMLNMRIACIVIGALGAIRCWYGFRKPTEEIGKAETAMEFMNAFFDQIKNYLYIMDVDKKAADF